MRRLRGWEHALDAYLQERRLWPFAWGSHDCCRFACGGVAVQTGVDPMQGVRPYKTARGAQGAIRRLGGTLDAAATALGEKAGLREVRPAFAGRGCVVLAEVAPDPESPVEPALGLVGMEGTRAWFAGPDGLVWRRMSDCRRAWGYD